MCSREEMTSQTAAVDFKLLFCILIPLEESIPGLELFHFFTFSSTDAKTFHFCLWQEVVLFFFPAELTLPQFYNFLHEMERAKASMECFSWACVCPCVCCMYWLNLCASDIFTWNESINWGVTCHYLLFASSVGNSLSAPRHLGEISGNILTLPSETRPVWSSSGLLSLIDVIQIWLKQTRISCNNRLNAGEMSSSQRRACSEGHTGMRTSPEAHVRALSGSDIFRRLW